MIIYKITNDVNNKVYIGQTTQSMTERFWQHSHKCPSQIDRSALHSAMEKYGKEHFKMEEIDKATSIEELNQLEVKYIEQFNSLSPNGYNLLKGGENRACHPETKAKISATLKGRTIKNRQNGAKKGRPITWGSKISQTMVGVPQPWKYKPVMAVETGILYESVQVASNTTGIKRTSLLYLLKTGGHNRKTGLSFKYA